MSQNQAQGFKFPWKEVGILPVQWHALALGLFPSIIAPFGGFFASGFKHAFKIKDFRDSIPGHGGIINRMDCQITCESDENQTIGRVLEPCMLVASLLVRVASTPCDLRCDPQHSVQKPTPCDLRCDPHHSAQKPTRHESHPIHADRIRACRQFQTEPN